MATTVPAVVAGNKGTATWGNAVSSAATELQTNLPDTAATWASPVSAGLTTTTGTIVARYHRRGSSVFCFFQFTFGASSAVTGDIILTLPVTATFTGSIHGVARYTDTGTAVFAGSVAGASTTTANLRVANIAGTYPSIVVLSSTVPFTWTTGDVIACAFEYLVA